LENPKIYSIFQNKSYNDDTKNITRKLINNHYDINNHNIFYIIEGNIMNFCIKNNETQQKTLFSSMLSLSYKKGFSLLHTSGQIETAEFIIRFIEKLSSEKQKLN
jgi:ERCC4-type nuclease